MSEERESGQPQIMSLLRDGRELEGPGRGKDEDGSIERLDA